MSGEHDHPAPYTGGAEDRATVGTDPSAAPPPTGLMPEADNIQGDRMRATPEVVAGLHARALRHHLRCRDGAAVRFTDDYSAATIIPFTCKTWACPHCGPRLRRYWIARIAAARPTRFVTLTVDVKRFASPTAAYEAMRDAFPKLILILRQRHITIEYVMVWETTEKGWPHIHAAIRGTYIPQKMLSLLWDQLGIGPIVDIRAVSHGAKAAGYITKYLTKACTGQTIQPRRHRVISASRHFFSALAPDDAQAHPTYKHTFISHRHAADLLEVLSWHYGFVLDPEAQPDELRLYRPAGPLDVAAQGKLIGEVYR